MNKLVKTPTEVLSILNKSTFMFSILGHEEDLQRSLFGLPNNVTIENYFAHFTKTEVGSTFCIDPKSFNDMQAIPVQDAMSMMEFKGKVVKNTVMKVKEFFIRMYDDADEQVLNQVGIIYKTGRYTDDTSFLCYYGKPNYENGTNIFLETTYNDCEEECFKAMFNTICKEQNYNGDYDSNPWLLVTYFERVNNESW